jgi:hypothetical protein
MVAVMDCPHVCCFDRSNRYHTHPTGADECELCARVPAAKVGRLRAVWRALRRWSKATLAEADEWHATHGDPSGWGG